jgi:signal transduction histidine kinase
MNLRTGLSITFFLAVLGAVAIVTGIGSWTLDRLGAEAEEQHLQRQNDLSTADQVELESRITLTAVRIAALLESKPDRIGQVDLILAIQAAELAGLDIFHVQDRSGIVLKSLHWPEQAGSRSVLAIPELSLPFTESVPDARSESGAMLVAVPVRTTAGEYLVLAGMILSDRSGGRAQAPLPLDEWKAEIGRSMIVAGLFLALAAGLIGLVLTRALARPVDEMVRAMDAVAEGREDHDFPSVRGDEFGPLVASFSRMRTALTREQNRVRAAERVAAWREAARRVAHEIKNPLVPIRLTMENMIKARSKGSDRFDPVFEQGTRAVLEEVTRLGRIVDTFGELARMPAPEIRQIDLDQVLDPVVALFAGEESLRINRVPPAAPILAEGDPDLLGQAIRNILSNCREAMGEAGGEITVKTFMDQDDVVIVVEDEGPGLPDEVLERIFDPYFTTREGGTGLGMAITQRIITEHGGSIHVANREVGGARFTLRIPATMNG